MRATQPPTSVPASAPDTVEFVARPLGANVTEALPPPVGPSGFLQLIALAAAALSAAMAAPLSKSAPTTVGAGAVSGFFASAGLLSAVGAPVAAAAALAATGFALAAGAAEPLDDAP